MRTDFWSTTARPGHRTIAGGYPGLWAALGRQSCAWEKLVALTRRVTATAHALQAVVVDYLAKRLFAPQPLSPEAQAILSGQAGLRRLRRYRTMTCRKRGATIVLQTERLLVFVRATAPIRDAVTPRALDDC